MYLHRCDPPGSYIAGIGSYLPDRVLTSSTLEERVRDSGVAIQEGLIERVTGVRERRVAAEQENASDLAANAARAALAMAGVGARDVDILLFAAASHDVTEPATANILQAKLGVSRAIAFDIKNACNSFLSALDVAASYVESGRASAVLVATGEIPSRAIDLEISSQRELVAKFAHLTMGDAGGAAVVMRSPHPARGIVATGGVTRGEAWHLSTILSGGTMYPRDTSSQRAFLRSRGCELEEYGRTEVPPVVTAVLRATGWTPESIGVVAVQQHSERIAREILCKRIGLPQESVMLPLRYAGNAAAANIPLCLTEAARQRLLRESSHVLLVGGSSGFSASAMAVRW